MTGTDLSVDAARSGVVAATRQRLRGRLAPVLYALALAFWASSWNLRLSVLMAWMPVEPVWVASFAVALCVVHRCGQVLRVDPAVAGPLVLVILGFLPGALRAGAEGNGAQKVAAMIFVLLPAVLAATVLLDSEPARRAWVWVQVVVGVSVAVAAMTTSHVISSQPGRFTLATVDTISAARMVGAAAVALALFAMTSRKHSLWAVPMAFGCGAVLVQVGSRGPLLFMLVSILAVVLAGRCFAGRRALLALATMLVALGAYRYALAAGGSGGQRILSWFGGGLPDAARTQLLADATRAGTTHPLGVGWGGFPEHSQTARDIANAEGVSYAHNAFAEAFSEGGWFALLGFTVIVVVAMSRLRRLSDQPQEAVLWGTAVYWLLNAMVSFDFVGNRFMWIALACGVAAYAPQLRRPRMAFAAPAMRLSRKAATE